MIGYKNEKEENEEAERIRERYKKNIFENMIECKHEQTNISKTAQYSTLKERLWSFLQKKREIAIDKIREILFKQ